MRAAMYAKRKGWSEQQNRLIAIANACPVHKTLAGTLQIETRLL